MAEVCPNCGLPKELCVCETIAKESQKIIVSTIKKAFGKVNTVIRGIDEKEIPTEVIGSLVMERLKRIDGVAYIRFASVYRSFSDLESFEREVRAFSRKPKDSTASKRRGVKNGKETSKNAN